MNRNLLGAFALLGGLIAGHQANATLIYSSSIGGAPTGVTYENFDSIPLGAGGGTGASGIVVSFNPNAGAVVGASSGLYAAPFLSGGNGAGFGNPSGNQPNGTDNTTYLASGSTGEFAGASITLTMPAPQQYFGLLWGSVDLFNTLQFFKGAMLVGTLTGADVLASPTGNQGVNGTVYVNINSDVAFTRVVATSSSYAFEFDNVAFNDKPIGVPEPLTLSVLGMGLLGLSLIRRQRSRSA